jgi:hypothetical protein
MRDLTWTALSLFGRSEVRRAFPEAHYPHTQRGNP